MNRRELLIGGAVLGACQAARVGDDPPQPPDAPDAVRIASVKTAVEGNVLPALLADFAGYRTHVTTGTEVYEMARRGEVDLVVSHYGHVGAEAFVMDGLGEWPRTLFSNQMALLGPSEDPAGVRGMHDLGEAFAKIAATNSPYVMNDLDGVRYLTEIMWNAAGRPDRGGWFIDAQASKDGAIELAASRGAYVLWGLTPFLRSKARLEPLVLADPLLQRMLVSIVVKPGGIRRPNVEGARALQSYLLSPTAQAKIRTVKYPGDSVAWVPGGRHNRTAVLPLT